MDAVDEGWRLAAKRPALQRRALMMQAIRRFFDDRGFLEVETPVRIPAPAPEPHIDAPASGGWFLQTSPELCMKRLLAAGYPRIYQISKCFREAERGRLHLPEFTMLEWYVVGGDCEALMRTCEDLLLFVAQALGTGEALAFRGRTIPLVPPWRRISVTDAFARHASLPLPEAMEQDRFDEMLACQIEPSLADGPPVFLFDYPAQHAALARRRPSDPSLAERFELYLGGLELANGFSELTDAAEQRLRFEQALHIRRETGRAAYPMPEPFLRSLECLPPAAGIALGLDRLAMLFTGAEAIDGVVAFPPEML